MKAATLHVIVKRAVSRQSSSFCLILPITRAKLAEFRDTALLTLIVEALLTHTLLSGLL